MATPSAGDAAGFREWARQIDGWRGEVESDRRTYERRLTEGRERVERMGRELHDRITTVDDKVDGVKEELAVVKTKVAFYAAIGSVCGGGIVTLIVAIGSKALGG